MATADRKYPAPAVNPEIKPFFEGDLPQLAERSRFELPDALLGHAEPAAELFEGLRLGFLVEAEAVHDDVPFALVQAIKDPHDRFVLAVVDQFLFELIGPLVDRYAPILAIARTSSARNRPSVSRASLEREKKSRPCAELTKSSARSHTHRTGRPSFRAR